MQEGTVMETRAGRWANASLAEHLFRFKADPPEIEVLKEMFPGTARDRLGIEDHEKGGHSPRAGCVDHAHVIADDEPVEHPLSAVGLKYRGVGEPHPKLPCAGRTFTPFRETLTATPAMHCWRWYVATSSSWMCMPQEEGFCPELDG